MGITIRQHDGKWRLAIQEEFETNDFETCKAILEELLNRKQAFGQLHNDKNDNKQRQP